MFKLTLVPSILLLVATLFAMSFGQASASESMSVVESVLDSSAFSRLANQEDIDC